MFGLLFSIHDSIAQTNELEPATIVDSIPSNNAILKALNGGWLTLSNANLLSGVTNKNNPYSQKQGSQIVIFNEGFKANLGMDSGVLFSTGDAKYELRSHNMFPMASYSLGNEYSDPDLLGIYSGATRDAVVFTFDVTLADFTSALRVAFQFGSEEYPDFVGSIYNDAFGFFVSGPGIKNKQGNEFNDDGTPVVINMARNPLNKNTISVNTINSGKLGVNGTFDPMWDLSNSSLYINNGHSDDLVETDWIYDESINNYVKKPVDICGINDDGHEVCYNQIVMHSEMGENNPYDKPVYIEYNGLTKLITYDLTELKGGGTYKFKIAIADSGDEAYESGVIIQKIQGTTGADLTITKEVDNMTPNVGDIVEFTLKPYNKGPYRAHDVVVKDILPDGYDYLSSISSIEGTSFNPENGEWRFPLLNELHERPFLKIKARVKSTGEYKNKVRIDSKDIDPDPTNNEDEVTPDVQKPAAIGLVKIGKVDDTVDGEYGNGVINYTFTITNEGDVPLKEINLEDFKIENQTSTIKPFIYVFEGDDNEDELLNVGEKWTTTATYHITDADTDAEKVENRATVYGKSPKDVEVSAESSDEQGKKQPTITPVEGGGPLMTNPHIYHKVQ